MMIGDYVRIICKDGAVFTGVIMGMSEDFQYIILNGCGFPTEDIVAMEPA